MSPPGSGLRGWGGCGTAAGARAPSPARRSRLPARAALCPGEGARPGPARIVRPLRPRGGRAVTTARPPPQPGRPTPAPDPTWPRRGRPQQQQRPLEAPGPAHGAAAAAAAARSRPGTCTARAARPAPRAPRPAPCPPGGGAPRPGRGRGRGGEGKTEKRLGDNGGDGTVGERCGVQELERKGVRRAGRGAQEGNSVVGAGGGSG